PWGVEMTKVSQQAGGKPVKYFLERDAELAVAGTRPSFYAKVKVGAKKDGTITAWESDVWGSGGVGNLGAQQFPYVFTRLPNVRNKFQTVATNVGPQRAWRAPNHPQMAVITMGALDDLAAKLGMDPLDFFLKNLELAGTRAVTYRDELLKAAELIEWKKNWRPRGEGALGSTKTIKRGLGVSMHTWGGGGHASNCDVIINPDGSVDLKMGSQELGTGTKTILMIVAA